MLDLLAAEPTPSALDLTQANRRLIDADAVAVVQWARAAFSQGLVMTTSFGVQSAVMLHLVTRVIPDIPVIWIDTGFLFPETYRFADELTARLKLNLKVYTPRLSPARLEALHGQLWNRGVKGMNQYHQIVKIEPMQRALDELSATAWLAGLRGDQTSRRAAMRQVDIQDGRYKVYPILSWTSRDVHRYLKQHDLPYHPLHEHGYASIGDTHSTLPVTEGMDERAGRFQGLKQECGLHIPASEAENESRGSSDL